MSNYITVATPDGNFRAYIARPRVVPAPAIVVIQEIFGVNADLRETCDELASQGYFAVSPDLFWRMEPGVDMSDQTQAEWQKGVALYNKFDYDTGVEDVARTLNVARTLPGASGKVFTYPGCMHAFARHRGAHYDKVAAALANGRTADFFKKHLA